MQNSWGAKSVTRHTFAVKIRVFKYASHNIEFSNKIFKALLLILFTAGYDSVPEVEAWCEKIQKMYENLALSSTSGYCWRELKRNSEMGYCSVTN